MVEPAEGKDDLQRIAEWAGHPRFLFHLLLITALLCLPALWSGLLFDDYFHRMAFIETSLSEVLASSPVAMYSFMNGDPERCKRMIDLGLIPWWSLENIQLTFWRPGATLTHALDYALWPESPFMMHLQSLLWFLAIVGLALLFYRQVQGISWIAGLAALLYAIDDGHSISIGWVANRNALLAVFFGLAALLFHIRWRRGGRTQFALWACLALAAGLLTNEGTIATCAYLFAYALFLDKGPLTRRVATLVPYAIVVVVWRVIYKALGYAIWGSYAYNDPLTSPLDFLGALLLQAPVLLCSQWLVFPAEIYNVLQPMAQLACTLITTAALLLIGVLLVPLLKADAVARFFALGMVLAVIPSCATFPSERLLLFTGIGAMGLLARYFAWASHTEPTPETSAPPRSLHRVLFRVFVVIHLVLAPILLPLRLYAFGVAGAAVASMVEEVPVDDEKVADQTVIVFGSPLFLVTSHMNVVRAVTGKPLPKYLRSLSATGGGLFPERITRVDDRTLVFEPTQTFTFLLLRDDHHPFTVGETVKLPDMTVEVLEVNDQGHATKVEYCFKVPLEDRSLVWLRMKGLSLEPFAPPAVGETVIIGGG